MLSRLLFSILSVFSFTGHSMSLDDTSRQFINFMETHNKSYSDSEIGLRYAIFSDNLQKINEHNSNNNSWTMGITKFSDLTAEEFKGRTLCYKDRKSISPRITLRFDQVNIEDLPSSIDWTTKGVVTPVKDQGQCGSCWAFSTTGSVEGAYAIATGKLVSFSEQQLVDCSGSYGNQACNGGLMDDAFQYIESQGICKEDDYSYTGSSGKCKKCTSVTKVASYVDVTANSEAELQQALLKGPVSVAVEADQLSWQFYHSGIVTSGCSTNLDHGVLLVGYGTENGQDYWKIKNSWGASWGEKGYIRIARNSKQSGGLCGIAMMASYPVIKNTLVETQ